MNGVMHFGLKQIQGGRVGDQSPIGLSDQLSEFGFEVKRLKTGTPARICKDSIDFSKTSAQFGDSHLFPFSYRTSQFPVLSQIACYLTRTSEATHEIIRNNLDKSPMYCGVIEGTGPRYCPSIEDKVMRFADRDSHQSFLEPEGLDSDLIYVQGISTSLPEDIQDQFLRTIPGLENLKVARYGYAVEYDYIEPTQIWHRLETRTIQNLFLAGQINGTSGYEEAAAQGFVAGINAAHKIMGREEFILNRDESYIGVLIDDLVTKGTREPYRMFTSRAEHRLVLREDNTIDRLADRAISLGIVKGDSAAMLTDIQERRRLLLANLREQKVYPNQKTQDIIKGMGSSVLTKSISFDELLRRPEVTSLDLLKLDFAMDQDPNVYEAIEIEVKYSGYVRRQQELISQSKKMEDLVLDDSFSYSDVRGLSREELDKLTQVRPRTLGQAQRISGVNPSAIQAIMIHLKSRKVGGLSGRNISASSESVENTGVVS
jgi:tRNA uridine 5-carboxymethylaminomethyl modification enzyme